MMHSLQSRLSSGLLLSLIVTFALLTLLMSISLRVVTDDYVASRLQHDSETLLGALQFNQLGKLEISPERIDQVYSLPYSGHYYIIYSESETHYSRSLWDYPLEKVVLDSGQQQRSIQTGPEQQILLVLSSAYTLQGKKLGISIAEDLNPIRKNIDQFIYVFISIAGVILLTLIVLQIAILRRSLKPLQDIHNELGELEQGKIERLNTDVPVELEPLINQVNQLLTLMQQRLKRSRDGLSDLAHAVKKPLTVIKQQINRNNIPESARQELMSQTDEIVRLSDRILKRARLAGHSHSGSHFLFKEDLSALADTLAMMYPDNVIELERQIPVDIQCSIDREDMMELLGNLLDNAFKWAKSRVRISVTSNEQMHITVEDDGNGIEPGRLHELSQRGARLDESIEGHGFGLAIARDTVEEYQGEIRFSASGELGGFRVDVVIPKK